MREVKLGKVNKAKAVQPSSKEPSYPLSCMHILSSGFINSEIRRIMPAAVLEHLQLFPFHVVSYAPLCIFTHKHTHTRIHIYAVRGKGLRCVSSHIHFVY